jgi:transposase
MGKSYRPDYPDEELLLPPSLRDWLPENHLAYFVSDVVDNLDLSAMDAVYGDEKRGRPPYDPLMMTKVLVYGYCVGVFSSRKMERRLVEDIAFRVLAGDNQPNFRTISDFRKIHLTTLAGLFEQVLQIALEAGAMKVGRVALDGTKVKANASKHKAMRYDRMQEKEKQLKAEVKQLLEQAEVADAEEDARYGKDRSGDELPAELERRETRLKKIQQAKRALQERAHQQAVTEGSDPKQATPKDNDQYNFTDPESRIMKSADGFVQAYNAQAAVEPDLQLIVGQTVTQAAKQTTVATPGGGHRTAERPKGGRGPGRQRLLLGAQSGSFGIGREAGAAYRRVYRHRTAAAWRASRTLPQGTAAEGCDAGGPHEAKAENQGRKAVYVARKAIVEPVFGQIRQARGFRQFLMRGIEKVRGEWSLVCLTHNILKCYPSGTSEEAATRWQ